MRFPKDVHTKEKSPEQILENTIHVFIHEKYKINSTDSKKDDCEFQYKLKDRIYPFPMKKDSNVFKHRSDCYSIRMTDVF